MRVITTPVPVSIYEGPSGGFNPINNYDFEPVAAGSNTKQMQIYYQFPAGFDANDPVAGMYNPRVYVENLPIELSKSWEWLMVTAPTTKATTAIIGADIPRDRVVDPGNIAKGTYWNQVAQPFALAYLQMQLQTTIGAVPYDTDFQDRTDPRLILEFDRQASGYLDTTFPVGESDHLWTFSQCDLYMNVPTKINGVTTIQRYKLGWIADEDFEFSDFQNLVKFQKGKPKAIAVQFMSEIMADIKFQLATMDPFLLAIATNQTPTLINNEWHFYETNTQRPIPYHFYSMEWSTNAGHWVRAMMPKAQMFVTGAFKPGANEIAKVPITITPNVGVGRIVVDKSVSASPIQRVELPFSYHTT